MAQGLPVKKIFPTILLAVFLACCDVVFAGNGKILSVSPYSQNGFTQNNGQWNAKKGKETALYVGNLAGNAQIYFFGQSFSYVFTQPVQNATAPASTKGLVAKTNHATIISQNGVIQQRIDVEFVNANTHAVITRSEPTSGINHYYFANCPDGISAGSFQTITYHELYPGIDLVFKTNSKGSVEYDFIIRPGANAGAVQLKYNGAVPELKNGMLVIKTVTGEIDETIPAVYQVNKGIKTFLNGGYTLTDGIVEFSIPKHNNNDSLVIDPWITYITSTTGGHNTTSDNSSYCEGVALDNRGNVIVEGYTNSHFFPTTPGVFQTTNDSTTYSTDAFVVKLDTGGHLIWSTLYGGSNFEFCYPHSVACDKAGNIFFNAETRSIDLPVSSGAFQATSAGGIDDFVVKLDSTGNRVWASYCGGSDDETSEGIAVDVLGNVIISGGTKSTNFPVSANAFQLHNHSASYYNAFIMKFDTYGTLQWGTYYGGSLSDECLSITTDRSANVIMASTSCSADYPVSAGAFQTVNNGPTGFGYGSGDVVLVKFDSTGNRLWATFYGGTGQDAAEDVITDEFNNIFITGASYYSTNFPTTPGVLKTQSEPNGDAFVVKFDSSGKRIWSTMIGGTNEDYGVGIKTVADGFVYLCGRTSDLNSPPDDFPVTSCAYQAHHGGDGYNWWFAKMDPLAQYLCYSSYLGGHGAGGGYSDNICDLAYANNTFYMCGYSTGNTVIPSNFPVTPGAFETTPSGSFNHDGTLAAINIGSTHAVDFTASDTAFCAIGTAVNFTSAYIPSCSAGADSNYTYSWYFTGGIPSTSAAINPTDVVYNSQGAFDVKLVVTSPCSTDTILKTGYIKLTGSSVAGSINANASSICAGSPVRLAFSGTGNIQWQSSADSIAFTDIPGATDSVYQTSALNQSTYFRVKATSGCGVDSSATFKMLVKPAPSPVAFTTDSLFCSDDSTEIQITGTYPAYLWNDGDTLSYTYAKSAGGYWVSVTGTSGCSGVSNHVNISVYPAPSVSLVVRGDTLSSYNATSYQWFLNSSAIQGATSSVYIAAGPGVYYVQITDSNGCNAVSNAVTITGVQNLKQGHWNLYPNPSRDYIVLDYSLTNEAGEISLEITNQLGQVVFVQSLRSYSGLQKVEVSQFAAGVYLVLIRSNEQVLVAQKFAKE